MLPKMGSVVCVAVFQLTWDPPDGSDAGRKFVPRIVMGNDELPATAQLGVILLIVGTGFGGGNTVKLTTLERPLFCEPECGLTVLTKKVPAFAVSAAGTTAVMDAEFTKVVAKF